jgi:ATP-dependent RNA helicase DeaD
MDLELFRIEVGREHGVEPSNIVGAIANEAGLDARNIGHISINDNFSMVELPAGMPKDVFGDLRKVWVCGQQLRISRDGEGPSGPIKDGRPPRAESKPRRKGPQGDDVKSEKKRAPKSRSKANSAEARPGSPEAKKKPAKRTPKPVDSDS